MCDYCSPKDNLNIFQNRDDDYLNRTICVYINHNDLAVETYSSDGQGSFDLVEVNYCPMCGRKL